ncbi:Ig-like domain-containing protein, partial [Listeria kieliensis]
LKKNSIRLTIISLVLVVIVSLVFPFGGKNKTQVDASTKQEGVPAIENTVTQVTDPKVLDRFNQLSFGKENWRTVSTDQWELLDPFKPKTVDAEGYFVDNDGDRYGKVTYQQGVSQSITFSIEGVMGRARTADNGSTQTFHTIKGHRYQLSYQVLASEFDLETAHKRLDNLDIPFENAPVGSAARGGRSLVELYQTNDLTSPPDFREDLAESNELKTTSFIGTGEEVMLLVGIIPDQIGISSVSYSHLAILDLDQGIEEVRTGVNDLFRDNMHSKLRLSVNQTDLDAVQDQIDLDLILDPLVKEFYQKELDKAQSLLDAVNPAIQIEQLVDNPKDVHSYTLIGKSYPEALIRFEGVETLPNPTMPSDDPRTPASYHVRTDAQGNFRMELPKGKFFRAGEIVKGTSMIHGKSAITSVTVQDVVAPQAPTLNEIKDQDAAFTGQAEAGTTVAILDVKQKEVAQAKADEKGQFSVAIPADKQPLTPYVAYVAIATDAAGNKSPASNKQIVQDTTPPEAKAVKHTFRQGEAAPKDPSGLLRDIYDNAGVERDNLTVSYETQPDFSKLGSQVVTVKLEDKAGNLTLIRVPVEVVPLENGASNNPGSGNTSAGTGSSQHIGSFSLPSTGDEKMTWTVALGALFLLAGSTLLAYRRKKQG